MLIEHSREKRLNLIGYFAKHTRNCGKTKLFKLLFYADFRHFQETGRPITGLFYSVWPKGPVPVELFEELKSPEEDFRTTFAVAKFDESERLNIVPKRTFKFQAEYFSPRELRIVEDVAFTFKNATAKQMVLATHFPNDPWERAKSQFGMWKPIPYEFSFSSSPRSLPREAYLERVADDREAKELFG